MRKLGIVIVGHGSRAGVDEASLAVFQIANIVKNKLNRCLVETAVLTRGAGERGIGDAVEKLVDSGAGEIIVAPMFLENGVHMQNDIPREIAGLRVNYPRLIISLTGNIGPDSRIADILVERIAAVKRGKLDSNGYDVYFER